MKKNLKETTEALGNRMVKEFVESKTVSEMATEDFEIFKIFCQWMDGIVELYEDVENLKKENEQLKKALEKES